MGNPIPWHLRSASRSPLPLVLLVLSFAVTLATVVVSSGYVWASPTRSSPSGTVHARRCGVSFSKFSLSPSTVSEGGSTTLDMVVHNCTGKRFSGSVETYGKVVCVIADPVEQRVQVRAHRKVALSITYDVPVCTGTGSITGQLLSIAGKTLASATASFQSIVSPPVPTIVPNPDSVMVDTATNLIGTDFADNETFTIKECAEQTWIVPQDPCVSSNAIQVTTNASGAFEAALNVEECATPAAMPGITENCYVGEATPQGIDTITLLGAAEITVTGS